ncbi:MAG TPA: hypothetical protein DDY91_13170 [Planctomycetaceae bacterium]|nr:hypothetical protein [Planctomycetaceae bacterium]
MSRSPGDSEPPPEQENPPGFWQRWYWPTVSLAALLAFELTASPALSAILLCCHFGLDDWLTGVWLWRNDPHMGRGRACAWFSFARAVTRTLLAAFFLLLLLVIVAAQLARNQPRGPGNLPAGFWGVAILLIVGLPLGSLLSLIACFSARRHSVKVWLDPGLHAARRAHQWPVSIMGVHNLADMPYLLMISVLLMIVLTPMIIAVVSLFPQKGPRPAFDIALVGVILATSVAFLWLLLRWTHQARARLPYECWAHEPISALPPAFAQSPLRNPGADVHDRIDPLDFDD